MDNLNISAEWVGKNSSVTGRGVLVEVNDRTFMIAVGMINE